MQTLFAATLGVLLLTAATTPPKHKTKHKSFQPVVRPVLADYAGYYVGSDTTYTVDIKKQADGKVAVSLHRGGDTFDVRKPQVANGILGGIVKDRNNHEQSFDAVFGIREINGRRDFGLLVNEPTKVDQDSTVQRFFLKLKEPENSDPAGP